jgi:hypothetical protein
MPTPALKINYRPTSTIEYCLTRSLPYLDCESANQEIIRLNCEVLRLQAELDSAKIKLWDEGG